MNDEETKQSESEELVEPRGDEFLVKLRELIESANEVAELADQRATKLRGVNVAALSFADGTVVIEAIRRLEGIRGLTDQVATDLHYQARMLKLPSQS